MIATIGRLRGHLQATLAYAFAKTDNHFGAVVARHDRWGEPNPAELGMTLELRM
jgi:hypothetical protein